MPASELGSRGPPGSPAPGKLPVAAGMQPLGPSPCPGPHCPGPDCPGPDRPRRFRWPRRQRTSRAGRCSAAGPNCRLPGAWARWPRRCQLSPRLCSPPHRLSRIPEPDQSHATRHASGSCAAVSRSHPQQGRHRRRSRPHSSCRRQRRSCRRPVRHGRPARLSRPPAPGSAQPQAGQPVWLLPGGCAWACCRSCRRLPPLTFGWTPLARTSPRYQPNLLIRLAHQLTLCSVARSRAFGRSLPSGSRAQSACPGRSAPRGSCSYALSGRAAAVAAFSPSRHVANTCPCEAPRLSGRVASAAG